MFAYYCFEVEWFSTFRLILMTHVPMDSRFLPYFACVCLVLLVSCSGRTRAVNSNQNAEFRNDSLRILPGADQLDEFLPLLRGKKVGMMGNQTSIVGLDQRHLVDVLLEHEVDLKFAFAPEHGF